MVRIHEAKGEYPKAIEMFQKWLLSEGTDPRQVGKQVADLKRAYSVDPEQGYWKKKLEFADLQTPWGKARCDIAIIYLHLGQKDSALAYLEKAEEAKSDYAFFAHTDKRLDPLRSDKRFINLMRKLGFEEKPPSHAKLAEP